MMETEFVRLTEKGDFTLAEIAMLRKTYNLSPNPRDLPKSKDEQWRVYYSATDKFNMARKRMARR